MNFQILFFKWSGTTLLGGLLFLDLLDNLDLVKLLLDLLVAVLLGQLGQIDDLSLGEALLVLALVSGTDSADDSLDLLLRQGLVLARGPARACSRTRSPRRRGRRTWSGNGGRFGTRTT